MNISQEKSGRITIFTIVNKSGATVRLSSLGAGIVSIIVPDADGNMADVVIGYDNPEDYDNDGPCAGKIPGRYANRIAAGRFTVDGQEFQLAINNGPNALHGGPTGFQNRIWDCDIEGDSIVFSYHSVDKEEGYPGNLDVKARYTWTDDNELRLDITASTDAPTIINLTNHVYFNLDGHDSGSVLNHTLRLDASHFLPTDTTLIPSGKIDPVQGTPMDFTKAKTLGQDIKIKFGVLSFDKGYDTCFPIDGADGTLRHCATLDAEKSTRRLDVYTTQPAVHLYTGNWLEGCPQGKNGATYHDFSGVALECQGYPDSPNHDNFPCQTLRPGETYDRTISFRFSNK